MLNELIMVNKVREKEVLGVEGMGATESWAVWGVDWHTQREGLDLLPQVLCVTWGQPARALGLCLPPWRAGQSQLHLAGTSPWALKSLILWSWDAFSGSRGHMSDESGMKPIRTLNGQTFPPTFKGACLEPPRSPGSLWPPLLLLRCPLCPFTHAASQSRWAGERGEATSQLCLWITRMLFVSPISILKWNTKYQHLALCEDTPDAWATSLYFLARGKFTINIHKIEIITIVIGIET